jgi:hypothetical protein
VYGGLVAFVLFVFFNAGGLDLFGLRAPGFPLQPLFEIPPELMNQLLAVGIILAVLGGSVWALIKGGGTGGGGGAGASDMRLKKDIKPIVDPLEKVEKLNGVTFKWKENSQPSIGFIAQDIQQVVPEIVHQMPNGYLGVETGQVTALLAEAVKEQQRQIKKQQKQIELLKEQVTKLTLKDRTSTVKKKQFLGIEA